MVQLKSFETVLGDLRKRKQWESRSEQRFNEAKCSICKRKLSEVGRSHLVGVCSMCVNSVLNPNQ